MNNFFKIVLASITGCLFSFILMIVLAIVFISVIISIGSDKKGAITKESILHITLDHPVSERGSKDPFDQIDFLSNSFKRKLGLYDIVAAIREARNNDKIKAIFLEPTFMQSIDYSSLNEIRQALIDFKSSGKPIIAYADMYDQRGYFLATVADSIFLNPQGTFDFRGLVLQTTFFKHSLQKLEIEPIVIRYGKYKNAVENFTLEKMSEDNRYQFTVMLQSMWNYYLSIISSARSIEVKYLDSLAENLSLQLAIDAFRNRLVDSLLYRDRVLEKLREITGIQEPINKMKLVKLSDFVKYHNLQKKLNTTSERIAVIYAVGEIVLGEGSEQIIGSDRVANAIQEARLDDRVKAIVLRVNSPGGSALASEVIWREIYLARKVKPVVVSMGNLAASGGYYISCAATKIVAQPTTITGSIGVFGLLLNAEKFFSNKLGITFDVVKTNKHSDMLTFTRGIMPKEYLYMRNLVDSIYKVFIARVAESRNLSEIYVDSIAQGRIWSGSDAMNVKLVDQLGGLHEAIELAAQIAGISDYKISELPVQKSYIEEIISDYIYEKLFFLIIERFNDQFTFLRYLRETPFNKSGIYSRLPYDISIH